MNYVLHLTQRDMHAVDFHFAFFSSFSPGPKWTPRCVCYEALVEEQDPNLIELFQIADGPFELSGEFDTFNSLFSARVVVW